MKVCLDWLGGVAFRADVGAGGGVDVGAGADVGAGGCADGADVGLGGVVFDGASEVGGLGRGMRPMEGVLAAAGACSAIDAVLILRKSRSLPDAMRVEISGERGEDVPRVFVRIHLHYVLRGGDVRDAAAERAVKLSVEKYCSALAMMKTATITHSWARE